MRKNIVKIQIIQTIFVGIIFIIALLEKSNTLDINSSFMAFYMISIFIIWFIMDIIIIINMHKNKKKEKRYIINFIFITIELILLGVFCGSIDRRVDIIEFSKHCDKTEAYVYYVDKDIHENYGRSVKNDYGFTVSYDYYFQYNVDGELYESKIFESTSKYNKSRSIARTEAEKVKPKYNVSDRFDIYYNTKNYEDWRMDITYAPEKLISIIEFIVIGFQLFCLGKAIKDYKNENIV